jgi:hypothetical protein
MFGAKYPVGSVVDVVLKMNKPIGPNGCTKWTGTLVVYTELGSLQRSEFLALTETARPDAEAATSDPLEELSNDSNFKTPELSCLPQLSEYEGSGPRKGNGHVELPSQAADTRET